MKAFVMTVEPMSPSLSSRGSGSAAGRKFFAGSSFNDGQGAFTQGISPTPGRAASSSLASNQGGSPFAGSIAYETLGLNPAGSRTLPEENSHLQSTRASQGSIDMNRDLAIGSVGSMGNQAELTNELSGVSHAQPLSAGVGVQDSVAELAQPDGSTTGVTAGSSALSTLPPSASWDSAPDPSPTPVHTSPPTSAVTELPAETLVSEPYQQQSSAGFAETEPESSNNAYSAQGVHPPVTQGAEVGQALPDANIQMSASNEAAQDAFSKHSFDAGTAGLAPQDGTSEHSFMESTAAVPPQDGFGQPATTAVPLLDDVATQSVVETPGQYAQLDDAEEKLYPAQQAGLDQTAQDGFAAQGSEQPTQLAQSDRGGEPAYQAQGVASAQTSQHGLGADSIQELAQHEQVVEPAYIAQGAGSALTSQHGFGEDSTLEPAHEEQIAEPAKVAGSAQSSQHAFGEGIIQEPALREQLQEPAYTAQSAVAATMAQDAVATPSAQDVMAPQTQGRQAGFGDDIFAQFSPLASRSNQSQQANSFGQQANPFAHATVVSPVAQEPVLEITQPVEPSMKVRQLLVM